ncbi:MAG TPA: hypothetical protein VF469_27965 [Kofleriaceae bacterium]
MTHLHFVLSIAAMVITMARSSYAQPGDTGATADQLLGEGRDLAKADRRAEACPRLEASLRDDPSLGARLDLAMCYQHVGKHARAWKLYRESVDLASAAGDVERRDYAQTSAAALEPHLARLTIVVPANLPAGFVVRWDGSPIAPGALGVSLYADAGRHELIASAPGFKRFKRIVTLVQGKPKKLAIQELAVALVPGDEVALPPTEGAAPGLVIAPPTEPVTSSSWIRSHLDIELGTAGLATAGSGLVFLAKARASFQDAKELCGASLRCNNNVDYDKGKQLIRDARSNATISAVLFAAGGAATAVGAIVFLTTTSAREWTTAKIAPMVHERGAGITITGRF